jgi:hypothetical protein
MKRSRGTKIIMRKNGRTWRWTRRNIIKNNNVRKSRGTERKEEG